MAVPTEELGDDAKNEKVIRENLNKKKGRLNKIYPKFHFEARISH
jgi:hypothetical protein